MFSWKIGTCRNTHNHQTKEQESEFNGIYQAETHTITKPKNRKVCKRERKRVREKMIRERERECKRERERERERKGGGERERGREREKQR